MEIRIDVLRRWAMHQLKRAVPDFIAPEQPRRRSQQDRKRRLERALSVAEQRLSSQSRPRA